MIRKATPADLPAVLQVYDSARTFMATNGNPTQWGSTYPPPELLEEDIRLGRLFVDTNEGKICGVFIFAAGDDPTYAYIEDGAWLDSSPYGVIHRVASDGTVPGTLKRCLTFCRKQCSHLRIDTHADNYVMQRLLSAQGFTRCGTIYVEDGSPRIAYEWLENKKEMAHG
ncbi:MAG: GNAT family N-acetyltransferase [Oscillospiraceae bacterium]|nr:GNAT family N-acetyltransferase [Oscillospiraceae bacterium]